MIHRPSSIFVPSFGNRPAQLVGRDGLIDQLVKGLQAPIGSRERAVVLLGQRGMGKTVLLWELADRMREQGYVVAIPTTASDGMLDRIIENIQIDGELRQSRMPASVSGATLGALGFSIGLQFTRETLETKSFHFKLRSLCKTLERQGLGVLVLVDEIQANSADMRQLVSAYQELVGERLNIAMVLAGLPGSVAGTLNDRVLTFLHRARKLALDPLALAEVDAFYARSFAELGISLSPELRRSAAAATQGSPYLMQLVGHYLACYAIKDEVTEESFANALNSAGEDFVRDVCEATTAALSQKDIAFLVAMSADEEESRMADIAQRLGVTPDYAQQYRRRLIDAGIISAPRRGVVAFEVPFLRDWLRR